MAILVIILQCVVKKLPIGKYKCSTKKNEQKKNNNKLLQRSSYILQLTCRVIESVFTLSQENTTEMRIIVIVSELHIF